ncbi:hypothetical protein TgHK011_004861 [Trichoderma gracile]|nr:hypothetical protein TgHK011_004861 [Trichoderma gracile]
MLVFLPKTPSSISPASIRLQLCIPLVLTSFQERGSHHPTCHHRPPQQALQPVEVSFVRRLVISRPPLSLRHVRPRPRWLSTSCVLVHGLVQARDQCSRYLFPSPPTSSSTPPHLFCVVYGSINRDPSASAKPSVVDTLAPSSAAYATCLHPLSDMPLRLEFESTSPHDTTNTPSTLSPPTALEA